MRFTTASTVIALATSFTQVQAFFLVAGHLESYAGPNPPGQSGNSWAMIDDLECNTLINAPQVNESGDVSGDKNGVRVEWGPGECYDGGVFGTSCPTEVEMHFSGIHQTWYADRDNNMYSLEGNVVGNCVVNTDTDKYCDVFLGYVRYQSLLECTQTA